MLAMFSIPYAESLAPASTKPLSAHSAIERGAHVTLHLFKPYMDELAYTALVDIVRTELERSERREDLLEKLAPRC